MTCSRWSRCGSLSMRVGFVTAGLAGIAIALMIDAESTCDLQEDEKYGFMGKLLLMPLCYEGLKVTARRISKRIFHDYQSPPSTPPEAEEEKAITNAPNYGSV